MESSKMLSCGDLAAANRGTIKFKEGTTLPQIFAFSQQIWKNFKISSWIRGSTLRFHCFDNNLNVTMMAKLKALGVVASAFADRPPKPAPTLWNLEASLADNITKLGLKDGLNATSLEAQQNKAPFKVPFAGRQLDKCAREVRAANMSEPNVGYWTFLADVLKAKLEIPYKNDLSLVHFRFESEEKAMGFGEFWNIIDNKKMVAVVGDFIKLKKPTKTNVDK
jgi:hypothetical protein